MTTENEAHEGRIQLLSRQWQEAEAGFMQHMDEFYYGRSLLDNYRGMQLTYSTLGHVIHYVEEVGDVKVSRSLRQALTVTISPKLENIRIIVDGMIEIDYWLEQCKKARNGDERLFDSIMVNEYLREIQEIVGWRSPIYAQLYDRINGKLARTPH